ncbi:ImmA/IrrE family metallo-endopeptidase [Aureimonas phyllosphaerae]|uniref:Zn-dependent peptidase ImmA (M78 family) n=1 Tax=Aureimonas phyllosphaerae TaxID=1166078 RepID=A0A7W6FWI1_9HYPH|nr:ImmA/IrrE family metallo-endopeptidase [Aureimonas phyllosphaerae]MBB3938238.1 Zn-dependent peptidase ImmA (M78 family) [Aureimonas phyllosphaerae]MBB3962245.1 Zn-dependent peptidase ImmA (M78 family) [Aureimonas phyllosphaerae]
MARLTMANVPSAAAEVIKRHQMEAPVKVGAIARDLGVAVLISDLPLAVSGMLSRNQDDRTRWTIRVNRHEHRHRQRFTIAHEIAHYVLHRSEIKDELVDDTFYRSGLPERIEYEANALAAEILMPWPLIRQLMDGGTATAAGLAEALEVSQAAMSIRLGLPT